MCGCCSHGRLNQSGDEGVKRRDFLAGVRGFKSVSVLLLGTNTEPPPPAQRFAGDPESRLLFRKHKWLLAHPDNPALLARGARAAITGPNLEVRYR